jgi:hypothetical protein
MMEYRRRSKIFTFEDDLSLPRTMDDLTPSPLWYERYWSYAKKLIGHLWKNKDTEEKPNDVESQPSPRTPRRDIQQSHTYEV